MNFYRKRAEDHSLSISNQVKHKHLKTDNDEIIIFEPDFPVFWEVQIHGGA